jgi:hypothetical protein
MVRFCNKYDLSWTVLVIVGFFRHNPFETVSLSAFRDKGLYSIEPLKKLVPISGLHKKFWLENVCYNNMRYFHQEVRIEKLLVRIL